MTEQINIRQAGISDIIDLTNLNKECLPIYYNYLQHLSFIMSSNNLVIIAEIKNKIIGYLIGEYNSNNNFHILSFGISEKYRSKGIGRKIINYIENNKKSCNNITLYVHDLNEKGINFYKKNGFNNTKYIKDYYKGALPNLSQGAYHMVKYIT